MSAGDDRLQRVEETLGFAERATEDLGGEVARAFEEIGRLRKRLAKLEARLVGMEEREALREAGDLAEDPESGKPPHAAG